MFHMPRKLPRYRVGPFVEGMMDDLAARAQDTPDKALVVTNSRGDTVGVFVTADEYNVLRSAYDFVKEPDSAAKISGNYEPKTSGLTFEQVFHRQ
jgi:hypothetical protein